MHNFCLLFIYVVIDLERSISIAALFQLMPRGTKSLKKILIKMSIIDATSRIECP